MRGGKVSLLVVGMQFSVEVLMFWATILVFQSFVGSWKLSICIALFLLPHIHTSSVKIFTIAIFSVEGSKRIRRIHIPCVKFPKFSTAMIFSI